MSDVSYLIFTSIVGQEQHHVMFSEVARDLLKRYTYDAARTEMVARVSKFLRDTVGPEFTRLMDADQGIAAEILYAGIQLAPLGDVARRMLLLAYPESESLAYDT